MLLDLILDPNGGYPLWLVILLGLVSAAGWIWNIFKSSFEQKQKGKIDIEQKQVDHDLMMKLKKYESEKQQIETERQERQKESETDKNKIEHLMNENAKLKQAKTALSIAILFIFDQYVIDNPGNKTVIDQVRKIIEENINEAD